MPFRRRASFGRRGPRVIVNTIKNYVIADQAISATQGLVNFAKAVNTPLSTVDSDVSQGCIIQAIYVTIDVCGTLGSGVLNIADMYVMKNPGNNLTPPNPRSQGTSNEKKFIFRTWRSMIMRNQDGNPPYHWEGWLMIPKRYQRMGTDDVLSFQHVTSGAGTGHISTSFLYKWKR